MYSGMISMLTWGVLELHWAAFTIMAVGYMVIVPLAMIFFLLPLIGAFRDTVDALRSGELRAVSPDTLAEKSAGKASVRQAWDFRVHPE